MAEESPRRVSAAGARLARSILHVLVVLTPAVPIAVTCGLQISRGWRPTSDDAAIAWRSWDVFSSHAPLVGAFNDATRSVAHPVFDLGPLEYYLLAIPERIDPVHGILWGAALVCAVLMGLAVEASWRAGGPTAAVAVAAGVVVFSATQPIPMIDLPWNPNIGAFAFSAALVLAAVAGTGRLGWWPVAVVAGSLAAQCHLVFGLPALACLAAGLGLGIWQRVRHRPGAWPGLAWPVGLGLGIGLLSLAAPLAQELGGHPGNLTLLVDNLRQGRSLGLAFGLRGIGRVAGLPPAWARTAPPISGPNWYVHFLGDLFGGATAVGLIILVAVGAIAVLAAVTGRAGLAALAAAASLSGLALAVTLGGISVTQETVVTYTDVALWPVGMALDAAVVWGVAELVLVGLRRAGLARSSTGLATVAAGAVAAVALVPLLVWSATTLSPATATDLAVIGGWPVARAVAPLAAEVERYHPRSAVLVEPSVHLFPTGLPTWALAEGLAYDLKVSGISARLMPPMQPELGGDAARAGDELNFLVVPLGDGRFAVRRVRAARPTFVLRYLVPG